MGQNVIQTAFHRSCSYCKKGGMTMAKTPDGKGWRLYEKNGRLHSCKEYDPDMKPIRKSTRRGVQP